MFSRKFRLVSPISKSSKQIPSTSFNLKIARNGLGKKRFGFIFSKKIDKRATVRNKMKRVLRSCVEQNVKKFGEDFDFLFVAKPDIVQATRGDILKEVELVLTKL